MSGIEIERHIPVKRDGRKPKYPWTQMAPGDSFLIPVPHWLTAADIQRRLHASAHRLRDQGLRVVTRTTPSGVRVWRVN